MTAPAATAAVRRWRREPHPDRYLREWATASAAAAKRSGPTPRRNWTPAQRAQRMTGSPVRVRVNAPTARSPRHGAGAPRSAPLTEAGRRGGSLRAVARGCCAGRTEHEADNRAAILIQGEDQLRQLRDRIGR